MVRASSTEPADTEPTTAELSRMSLFLAKRFNDQYHAGGRAGDTLNSSFLENIRESTDPEIDTLDLDKLRYFHLVGITMGYIDLIDRVSPETRLQRLK